MKEKTIDNIHPMNILNESDDYHYYGDMKIGLMCLGCGRITEASSLFWSWVYKPRVNKVPIVYLACPDCRFIKPVNVTYMKT